MITVVTPFSRIENLPFLEKVLKDKCHWIILQANNEPVHEFPEWAIVKRYEVAGKHCISNRLFNQFIASGLDDNMQYMLLNDDDSVEEGFFAKIPDAPVVCVSMKRTDKIGTYIIWDNWQTKTNHLKHGIDTLIAHQDNMKVAQVAGEQLIVKGHVLKNFRYGLTDSSHDVPGDAKFVMQILYEYEPVYVPDAFILFNYFEDGRFTSFRRKPIVMFIGDYYCAGVLKMGISEWETNLWKSLESTELMNIARFHFDKYYYHFGKRGDEALLKAIEDIKPDYVVLIIYKQPGSDPTVIQLDTIANIKVPIISIWGDLEAEEQQALAKGLEPFMYKVFGTANEAIVTRLGYTYMHVPKDPRIFSNPNKERDIDVLFNGSFGYGREERNETLKYLQDNGVKLVVGGGEGRDHFTTEEYADRYKRAKISIGFSQARGMDVINARCFEAMLCGSLYIVQESKEMEKLYKDKVDYVSWTTKEDLLQKIQKYLTTEELEREFIAQSGQKKTEELYSAKTFWQKVLS